MLKPLAPLGTWGLTGGKGPGEEVKELMETDTETYRSSVTVLVALDLNIYAVWE